jgi:hypothetical protein
MSRKNRTTLTTVEKLIEQRRQYEDWLAKLDEGPAEMPDHVIERVRNDYRTRLTEVMSELGEHQDALREVLGESQQRFDVLRVEEGKKQDEMAELKLRRHVGELEEVRFREMGGELKNALDQMAKDIAGAQRDIERYEEILGTIAESESVPEPEPEEEAEPAEPEPQLPLAQAPARAPEPPRREERRSSPAVERPRIEEDELAFLRSVTSTVSPRGKGVRIPQPPPAPPVEEPPEEAPPVTVDAMPHRVVLPPVEEESKAPAPSKAPGGEEAKTLVCGECGARNRPTEWYCEKCGAELSSF